MKVTFNINHSNNLYFKNTKQQNSEERTKEAIMEGAQWFGVGVGVDAISSRVNLFKSRFKQSLFVNFLLAICASAIALLPKHNKNNTISNSEK